MAGEDALAKSQWSFKTATEISAALKAKEVSAVELAQDAIDRIERHDAKINAVCVRDFARGLEAARAADAALARGEHRPLLGLPMTVKESYNVGGLPTTWGFPAQKDFVPPEDALTIARVKDAGGVILGKTNVPIGLGDWQSHNEICSTSIARPAAPPADHQRRWRRAMGRSRSAPISAGRCACRRFIAASMPISRPSAWCRAVVTRRRRFRPYRSTATSRCSGRWRAPPPTLRCCLT
jgi:Amidase